jgi:simple sugar transport system ATP-binding protein
LDVGATEYIRRKILEQRDKGAAILLVSSDLEEILSLSDRLAVMFDGRFAGIMETSKADVEQLGLLMTGS